MWNSPTQIYAVFLGGNFVANLRTFWRTFYRLKKCGGVPKMTNMRYGVLSLLTEYTPNRRRKRSLTEFIFIIKMIVFHHYNQQVLLFIELWYISCMRRQINFLNKKSIKFIVWQKVVFFLNIFLIHKMLKIGNTQWQILRRLPSKVLLKPNTSISFLLVCGGGEKLILLTGSISRECRRYILFQEKNKRALVFVPYFSPLYLTPISPTPSTKEKNRAGIKRNCSWH